jgi:hypothetical protein
MLSSPIIVETLEQFGIKELLKIKEVTLEFDVA